MKKEEILEFLNANKKRLAERYGVRKIALFGSYAREEAKEESDIDLFVEMEPDLFSMVRLKKELEAQFGKKVDLVRDHSHLKPLLRKMIERESLRV